MQYSNIQKTKKIIPPVYSNMSKMSIYKFIPDNEHDRFTEIL